MASRPASRPVDASNARKIARLSDELAACRVREQEKEAQLRAAQAEIVRVFACAVDVLSTYVTACDCVYLFD